MLGAGVFFVAFSSIIFAFGGIVFIFFSKVSGHRCGASVPPTCGAVWPRLWHPVTSGSLFSLWGWAGFGWLPATSGQANAYGRLRAGQGVQLLPFAVLLCVQSFCRPEVTIMKGLGVRICPAALWQRCASMLHGDSCGSHVRFPQRKVNGTMFIPKGPKSKTVSVNKN